MLMKRLFVYFLTYFCCWWNVSLCLFFLTFVATEMFLAEYFLLTFCCWWDVISLHACMCPFHRTSSFLSYFCCCWYVHLSVYFLSCFCCWWNVSLCTFFLTFVADEASLWVLSFLILLLDYMDCLSYNAFNFG